jgi:hypothetical protein
MKTTTSHSLTLAAALLIVIASVAIAAAQQTDTCVGLNATIGGTCAPLTNSGSLSNDNTALGGNALMSVITGTSPRGGFSNTAVGTNALQLTTLGVFNTAVGHLALSSNTTGTDNTAIGQAALENANGNDNTAIGRAALASGLGGNSNTATGSAALESNTTGSENTATGDAALFFNTTGNKNIGVGPGAGQNLTTGNNNIDIFDPGVAGESNTIRIGTQGTQTATFIAGIFGGPQMKKACDVMADSTGLLGCAKSSARYKRDIRNMGDASDKLMKLRPVTFTYKADSTGIQQYGLIAEEVEKVYPELVIDGTDGMPETVAYQVLPAMLLNEVQKERRDSDRKTAQIAKLSAQVSELKAWMAQQSAAFEERLSRLEQTIASTNSRRKLAAAFER